MGGLTTDDWTTVSTDKTERIISVISVSQCFADVLMQAYLLLAISRGAAIIRANGHVGIDIVVPVLIGTSLKKENVTAILVQVRNSRHYGAKIKQPVFANMDPYLCGLFDRDSTLR